MFSRRVVQLEQFILSLGADVPPITNDDDAAVLSQIAESMPLSMPSVGGSYPVTEKPSATADSTMTTGHLQSGGNPHLIYDVGPNFFHSLEMAPTEEGGMLGPLEMSPGTGFSHEPYDFMMPGAEFQPDIDMSSVDWVWSMSNTDLCMPIPPAENFNHAGLTQSHFEVTRNSHSLVMPLTSQAQNTEQNVHGSNYYGGSSSEDENDDEIIEQLSVRFGDLQMGDMGEFRYYGPTSNLTLTESGIPHQHRNSVTSRSKEAQVKLEQAGIGDDLGLNLIDHLIDLYFTWQDPSCHVVDKKIFYEERDLYRSSDRESALYSAALENAM